MPFLNDACVTVCVSLRLPAFPVLVALFLKTASYFHVKDVCVTVCYIDYQMFQCFNDTLCTCNDVFQRTYASCSRVLMTYV